MGAGRKRPGRVPWRRTGVGKSTLLAFLRQAATERRFAVAETVADRGWTLPYAPWASLLDHLGIGSVPLAASPASGMSADDYRQWAHRSVLTALRDAASRRPVLLIVDDLQWVDPPSRDLLLHVLRGTSSLPVLCAGSWRNPLSQRTPDMQAFVANLRREPATTTLDLAGLAPPEIAAIASRFGWMLSQKDLQHLAATNQRQPVFRGRTGATRRQRWQSPCRGYPAVDPATGATPDLRTRCRHPASVARGRDLPERVRFRPAPGDDRPRRGRPAERDRRRPRPGSPARHRRRDRALRLRPRHRAGGDRG